MKVSKTLEHRPIYVIVKKTERTEDNRICCFSQHNTMYINNIPN